MVYCEVTNASKYRFFLRVADLVNESQIAINSELKKTTTATGISEKKFNDQEQISELRRNNFIPGVNVPYFRDNFIPGIYSVPERRDNAIKGINLG